MADEFLKGLGILTGAGFGWMVLAGWYNTVGFAEAQLIGPGPADPGGLDALALLLKEGLFWFAILGAITFWVLVPAMRHARQSLGGAE